jgi:hypothetical protein
MIRENGYAAIGGLNLRRNSGPIAAVAGYMQLTTNHILGEMIEPLSAV